MKHIVAQLREVIGKSQTQFAAMIGVSKHTVISVENRRLGLSKNLAKRIEIATGANLLGNKLLSPFKVADYTRGDFDRWRDKYSQTNPAVALKQLKEMQTWLKVIFLAAAKSGRAGNRDRLPALSISLAKWLNEARKQFKLNDEIEDVLAEETRAINTSVHTISALLKNPASAKKELAEHDIDFSEIENDLTRHKRDGFLFIQDEYRSTWSPGGFPHEVPCRPRKLIPQARYWIKEFKGSLAALQQTGFSHPELNKYLHDIAEEKIPIPEFKTGGKS